MCTCLNVTCWTFLNRLPRVQVTPAVFIDSSVPPSLLHFHLKLEIASMEREMGRWECSFREDSHNSVLLSSVERYVWRLKIEHLQRPSNRAYGSFLHTDTHTYNVAYFFHVITGKKGFVSKVLLYNDSFWDFFFPIISIFTAEASSIQSESLPHTLPLVECVSNFLSSRKTGDEYNPV